MKQYEDAIKIIEKAILDLRETHIFPDEVLKLEISLGCDILFLKGCEKKRLDEAMLLSQGSVLGNEAQVSKPNHLPISLESGADGSPTALPNSQAPGKDKPSNAIDRPRASTPEKRRLQKLRELGK